MNIRTCPNGHLTAMAYCTVCKREDFKQAKRALAAVRRENKELKRQIKNLTDVIAAGRAF